MNKIKIKTKDLGYPRITKGIKNILKRSNVFSQSF